MANPLRIQSTKAGDLMSTRIDCKWMRLWCVLAKCTSGMITVMHLVPFEVLTNIWGTYFQLCDGISRFSLINWTTTKYTSIYVTLIAWFRKIGCSNICKYRIEEKNTAPISCEHFQNVSVTLPGSVMWTNSWTQLAREPWVKGDCLRYPECIDRD